MGVRVGKEKKYNDALRFIDDLVLELSASRDLRNRKIFGRETYRRGFYSKAGRTNLNAVYKIAQRTGLFSFRDLANVIIEGKRDYFSVSVYPNDRAHFSVLRKVVNRLFAEQEYSFDNFYFNDGLVF